MLSTVQIINHKVYVKGELIFEQQLDTATEFLSQLYKHSNISYPKFHKMDNLCKLGILATELLLQQNNILQQYDTDKIGIVLSNAASSIETDRQHQNSISDKSNYFPSPAVFVYTLPNIVIGEIAIKYKITGENTFLISEKFEPQVLINYAQTLFISNTDAVITGWVEMDKDNFNCLLFILEKGKEINPNVITQLFIE